MTTNKQTNKQYKQGCLLHKSGVDVADFDVPGGQLLPQHLAQALHRMLRGCNIEHIEWCSLVWMIEVKIQGFILSLTSVHTHLVRTSEARRAGDVDDATVLGLLQQG